MTSTPSSVLQPILDSLRDIDGGGESASSPSISSVQFLHTCRLILPVFDKLGIAFLPAKADVSGNIERLAKKAPEHPALFDIALAEVAAGSHAGGASCCKGLLWLKRFLAFTMHLLDALESERDKSMREIAGAAYVATLKPYHGFIASSAFSVVLHFPPSRDTFVASLGGESAHHLIASICAGFNPILERISLFLQQHDLDDPTPV